MTMDRWWDPEEPGTVMTSNDVLLAIGDDPDYDLGAALFAVHKAGAAAIRQTADTPVFDERTMVHDLARARENYAPLVVESISKSLGDPTYAGLLVRDVADAAERSAVDLFSAAVAKGVAPPLAAQRAAMVYGVPTDRMGAFRGLALAPATPVVALQDAADRALFAYIGELVEAETSVSKADYLEQHNEGQNAKGQFVRLKEKTAITAASIAEALRGKPAEQREQRELRTPREKRELRELRTPRASRPREVQTARRTTASARSATRNERKKDLQRAIKASERVKFRSRNAPARGARPQRLDVTQPISDNQTYGRLHLDVDASVGVFIDPMTYHALDIEAAKAGDRFRLGAVSGTAAVTHMEERSPGAEEAIWRIASQVSGKTPTTLFVPYSGINVETLSYEQSEAIRDPESAKHLLAMQWLDEAGLRTDSPMGRAQYDKIIDGAKAYESRDGRGIYWVYAPDGAVTTVNELRVAPGDHDEVRGSMESKSHLELDPNQVYELIPNDGQNHQEELENESFWMENTWDGVSNAMVQITYIRPAREPEEPEDPFGFSKASEYLTEHDVTQDQRGRFTSAHQIAEVLRQKPREQREMRQAREQRVLRTPRTVLKPVQRTTRVERTTRQNRKGRHTERSAALVRRLIAQAPETFPNLGVGDHVVMSGEKFEEMLHAHGVDKNDAMRIPLNKAWTSYLAGKEAMGELGAAQRVMWARNQVALDARENHYDDLLSEEPISLGGGDVDYTASQATKIIESYMRHYPQYSDFAVEIEDRGVDLQMTVYGIPWVQAPVIVTNEVDDWTKPVEAVRTTKKIDLNEAIMTTPKPTPDEERREPKWSDAYKEPDVLTFTRAAHEHYTLRNTGGKPTEKG